MIYLHQNKTLCLNQRYHLFQNIMQKDNVLIEVNNKI